MTDTGGEDVVDDVVVVGQRRRDASAAFSTRGVFTPGEIGNPPSEVSEGTGIGGEMDPCSDPALAREWNADAAVAGAIQRMLDVAMMQHDEPDFSNREYGTLICENSSGGLSIAPIQWGDPILDEEGNVVNPNQQPSVPVNPNACGTGTVPLAMIHTHPGSDVNSGLPSSADISWIGTINAMRGDTNGRIYVVHRDANANTYRIRVYDQTNAEGAALRGELGDEVNPEGQPCPGVVIS